jgi:hypothetical protein
MEVKPYSRYSGTIVSIGNFSYSLNKIPEEFKLVANIVDEDTEEKIINLISNRKEIELKQIMKCIAAEFQPELKYTLNDFTFGKIKTGDGMPPEKEDSKYYNPCVVVINLGTDIEMSFIDTKTKRQYSIMIPRRSMFLFQDKEFKYQRSITKRFVDKNDNREYKREDRYSLVFKSRK